MKDMKTINKELAATAEALHEFHMSQIPFWRRWMMPNEDENKQPDNVGVRSADQKNEKNYSGG